MVRYLLILAAGYLIIFDTHTAALPRSLTRTGSLGVTIGKDVFLAAFNKAIAAFSAEDELYTVREMLKQQPNLLLATEGEASLSLYMRSVNDLTMFELLLAVDGTTDELRELINGRLIACVEYIIQSKKAVNIECLKKLLSRISFGPGKEHFFSMIVHQCNAEKTILASLVPFLASSKTAHRLLAIAMALKEQNFVDGSCEGARAVLALKCECVACKYIYSLCRHCTVEECEKNCFPPRKNPLDDTELSMV